MRQYAFTCIQHLTRLSPKTVFSHLDRLFQGGVEAGHRTLLMVLLEEQVPSLRLAIVAAGKPFFATASERQVYGKCYVYMYLICV
jgi:CobQ-like glutamine amidotransferase family enzyme